MEKHAKVFIAGHSGLVGSAIVRKLKAEGFDNLILNTHAELDLSNQAATEAFFQKEKPEYVIVAAGLVGGIQANSKAQADFFYVNMSIAENVIMSAYRNGVTKLLYLGSSCMYPKECPQPMKEEMLLTGPPEPTNEGYALAKIGGSRLCTYLYRQCGADFISAIPANAYGLNDKFDSEKSHVIPALIMKYHNAKRSGADHVVLWGSGRARREFLYTDDLADACLFLMDHYSGEIPINIGAGNEISIMELSILIKKIVGFKGEIVCDLTKPDGMMRRMVDSSRINSMGWHAATSLEDGLQKVYAEYLSWIR